MTCEARHITPLFGEGITNFLLGIDYLSKILETSFIDRSFENLNIDW